MEPTPTFDLSQSDFSNDLQVKRMKELEKYDTRYFFVPFQDVAHPSLQTGYAKAGEIVAIDAPKRPIPAWDLPMNGAETLGFARHQDQHGNEVVNKSVVIYLDEPGPIINTLVQWSLSQGGTEIVALKGMPGETFTRMNVNALVFGDPVPRTADGLRAKMQAHLDRVKMDRSEGAQKLAEIAVQIIQSVDRCIGYTSDVLRETHAEMDTAKAGNNEAKKRYDRRDRRALEFSGAVPRDEVLTEMAREQRETQKAIPSILERLAEQEARSMELAKSMLQAINAQTEALKVIAANAGNGGAQATENQPKAKK